MIFAKINNYKLICKIGFVKNRRPIDLLLTLSEDFVAGLYCEEYGDSSRFGSLSASLKPIA